MFMPKGKKVIKKVIFLDRDGVINKYPGGWTEHNYVTRPEDFIFLPGSKEAIKRLSGSYDIILISNQAGIAKGHYSEGELKRINENMLNEISASGGRIKKIFYCVHQDSDNCDCRKPKTGLFKKAEKELGLRVAGNFFIGDGKTDIEAGEKAGLTTVLVLSGKTSHEDLRDWESRPDYIFDDLLEAARFILDKKT